MRPLPHGIGCKLLNEGMMEYLMTGQLPTNNRNSSPHHQTWSHLRTLKADLIDEGAVLVPSFEDMLSVSGQERWREERGIRGIEHAR